MSLDTVARHGFMQAPEITSGTTLLIDQAIQPHAAQTEKLPTWERLPDARGCAHRCHASLTIHADDEDCSLRELDGRLRTEDSAALMVLGNLESVELEPIAVGRGAEAPSMPQAQLWMARGLRGRTHPLGGSGPGNERMAPTAAQLSWPWRAQCC